MISHLTFISDNAKIIFVGLCALKKRRYVGGNSRGEKNRLFGRNILYGKNNAPLPINRRILISAGNFKFALRFFIIAFYVSFARFSYLASVSALLAVPVLFLMPAISKRLNDLKYPLGKLLLPFVLSTVLICPIFVLGFRVLTMHTALNVIFTLLYLPLFCFFISIIDRVDETIECRLNGDAVYNFAALVINAVAAIIAVASMLFDKGVGFAACLVGIVAIIGLLIKYMAFYGFSSRFNDVNPPGDIRFSFALMEQASFVTIGVVALNACAYCLLGLKSRWIFAIALIAFGLVAAVVPFALKKVSDAPANADFTMNISTLAGLFIFGLIRLLKVKKTIVIASVAACCLLLFATVIFRILEIKRNKGDDL